MGNQDIGVFLLSSSNNEIYLGKIFLRNGAGEFRTSVSVNQVAGTDQSIDQCYGLTIHNMEDSWQNYTTIWEDAVTHAAEVELEEAVSELAEEQEMNQTPESTISETKLEEVVINHKSSILESIEAEIQAQSQMEDRKNVVKEKEEEIPSTFVEPQKEENQTLLWPREEETLAVSEPEKTNVQEVASEPCPPIVSQQPERWSEPNLSQPAASQPAVFQPTGPQMTGRQQPVRPFQPTAPFRLGPRTQTIRQFPSAQWQQTRVQSEPWAQPQQIQQPQQPVSWEQQQKQRLDQLEKEEPIEEVGMEKIWLHFCKTCPKIQAFDYNGDCEILTMKPQDIGLLPREVWTYGNNSFLLHGYYNHRYLIMARLNTPNGAPRFLLGVPGHYYSNEKYMATMFGFPNFVLSKTQPAGDSRFGYWYTDIRLGS